MAPAGAVRQLLTPGQDPMALITRLRFFFLLFLMVLPATYGRPTRTERLISETDEYYWVERQNDRIRCQLCPAGTYVVEPCTIQKAKGICENCPTGTFSMYSSGMGECISCSRCRDDQEEVSSCTITKNTKCKCKKGTFCPPDQPCEICSPCTTSCPEDQVVKEPCNSTSDLLCTTPSSSSSTSTRDIIITAVAVSAVFIIVIISVWILRKRRNNNTGCKLFGKLTDHICKGNEECEESEDHLLEDNTSLQFNKGEDGQDLDEDVNKAFPIIVWLTPIKHFETLMLNHGLSPNEINGAKLDNHGSVQNQHVAMLHALNQQKKFDINIFLKSLRRFGLKKAAHDIAKRLLSEKLCIPKTQQ